MRNHTTAHHTGTSLTTLATQNGEVLQIPASHVAALQPFRAVALKQISPTTLGTAIGLPVKTIQGLVVATKPAEGANIAKGNVGVESNFDTIAFPKGSTIQMAVPALVQPQNKANAIAGLVVNNASATITQAVGTEQQTLTTTLGVLTPATSPQMPPADPSKPVAISLLPNSPAPSTPTQISITQNPAVSNIEVTSISEESSV